MNEKILIVDDVFNNIKVIMNYLKGLNFDLFFATSGEKAIQSIQTNKPNLILMDVMMPDVDGLDTVKKIKEDTRYTDIPVIFITALSEPEDISKGFKVGGVDYITKPVNSIELIARIKIHLQLEEHRKLLEKIVEDEKNEIDYLKMAQKKQDEIITYQSKMAAIGEMIENIVHQWRQPLSVISAAASGIKFKDEMNVVQDGDIEKTMNQINISVQHLSQTITDFRNFFKINKAKNLFVLKNTFEKTFKLIVSQFKTSNITVEKNIEEVTLFGFENELIQVFINILNNARDELVKKDQKIKLIIIDTIVNEHSLEIYIKDNAGGIPENIIDEVFASHFTTKQDSNGTGVGLYMSKMIIEEHMNGTIEAKNINFIYEDNSYTGALFKICLPF